VKSWIPPVASRADSWSVAEVAGAAESRTGRLRRAVPGTMLVGAVALLYATLGAAAVHSPGAWRSLGARVPPIAVVETALEDDRATSAKASDAALASLTTTTARDVARGEWPELFGPRGDSRSDIQGLDWEWPVERPPQAWQRSVGRGYSSPIARGQRVFVLQRVADDELVAALDLQTGELLWEFRWPTDFRCRYEYSDGPYGTPLALSDRLLAVGATGQLVCLDTATGRCLWRRDLRREFDQPRGPYGFGSGLLVDEDRVLLNVGAGQRDAGVVAFDLATGETRWTATDHGAAFTTPRIVGSGASRRVVVLTDRGLVALEPETGRECWFCEHHSRVTDTINAVSPLVQGSRVLLVAGPGAGAVCLEAAAESYRVVWRDRRVLDSIFNTLVADRGRVFGFGALRQGGATLRRLDLATGRLDWQVASEIDRGQALAVDGRLVIVGEYGHLGRLGLDDPTGNSLEVSAHPVLPSPCYSAPALHHGRLLIRNETRLVCYDLRPHR